MSEGMINLNTEELRNFGSKLISIEEDMKTICISMKKHVTDAGGQLMDENNKFLFEEVHNMIEELEKLLDGGISEIGQSQISKADAINNALEEMKKAIMAKKSE